MRGVFDEEDLEPVSPRRDTELTLGSGTLLAIFFGLVLLCGLCFGLGYTVGHRGASNSATAPPGATTTPLVASPSAVKPSAAAQQQAAPDADTAPTAIDAPHPSTASGASVQTAPGASNPVQSGVGTQPIVHPAFTQGTAAPSGAQPAANGAVRPALGQAGSFLVQIAAVSNQEDADVLTTALRRHGYTVMEQREPIDSLIHVRIGPFATPAEANSWKNRLLNDGYNAIVQQ